MKISSKGVDLIKKFEGCVLQVYLDAVGVKTVGYGHTGLDVNSLPVGARISQQQADLFLKTDIIKFEERVNKYDSIYHWTQNETDALCSFVFNIGSIDQLTAKGTRSKQVIANTMLSYNKAGGKVLSGLSYRRQIERELFLGDSVDTELTYQIGNNYSLLVNLFIREKPYGNPCKINEITISARNQSHENKDGDVILNKGTKVTCKGVIKVENSTWIKIPSGWICAREGDKRYIE